MKAYSEKLIELLRRKMLEPRADREERSAINTTDRGYDSLTLRDARNVTTGLYVVEGEDYLLKVDKGGNKRVSQEALIDWILAKPVNYKSLSNKTTPITSEAAAKSLAKVIQRSIRKVGTRPAPFIQEAIDEHLKNLKVVAPVVEDVKENVELILRQAGFKMEGKTVKFA